MLCSSSPGIGVNRDPAELRRVQKKIDKCRTKKQQFVKDARHEINVSQINGGQSLEPTRKLRFTNAAVTQGLSPRTSLTSLQTLTLA